MSVQGPSALFLPCVGRTIIAQKMARAQNILCRCRRNSVIKCKNNSRFYKSLSPTMLLRAVLRLQLVPRLATVGARQTPVNHCRRVAQSSRIAAPFRLLEHAPISTNTLTAISGRRIFHTASRRSQRGGKAAQKPSKPAMQPTPTTVTPPLMVRTVLVGTIVGVCTPIYPVIGMIRLIM